MKLKAHFPPLTALAIALVGCGNTLDPYAKAWPAVAIGQAREAVHQTMGQPSTVHSIELPLGALEQHGWRAVGGRHYFVHFALGRAVAKVVID